MERNLERNLERYLERYLEISGVHGQVGGWSVHAVGSGR
jgi:hypothetical protein